MLRGFVTSHHSNITSGYSDSIIRHHNRYSDIQITIHIASMLYSSTQYQIRNHSDVPIIRFVTRWLHKLSYSCHLSGCIRTSAFGIWFASELPIPLFLNLPCMHSYARPFIWTIVYKALDYLYTTSSVQIINLVWHCSLCVWADCLVRLWRF